MVQSYLSDKIEKRTSKITGMGIFAKETIHKGEVICVKGGHILKRNEMFSSAVINSYHPISDDLYIAAKTLEEEENIKIYINHSCNPNCGLRGEITFVAMREIQKDEEVTFDYAFLDTEAPMLSSFKHKGILFVGLMKQSKSHMVEKGQP